MLSDTRWAWAGPGGVVTTGSLETTPFDGCGLILANVVLVNFELILHLCLMLHFMHYWKDGWCRLKEFGKYVTLIVKSLQCILYIPPLRGILLSMAQNYTTMSHLVATSTIQYEKMIDNIGHMFCILGISEFSVNALSLCTSSCPQQL